MGSYKGQAGIFCVKWRGGYSAECSYAAESICADNGIGISREFIPSVFEPFSRAEDPRISKVQGTGLGVAITENIVRMMNETITVESELGKGSKFTVSIPLEVCMGRRPETLNLWSCLKCREWK